MTNLRRQIMLERKEQVVTALNEGGSLTYKELATACDLTYPQVRWVVRELTEEGLIQASKGQGSAIYITLKGSSAIPKIMGGKGFVPFTQAVRVSTTGRVYNFDFNAAISNLFGLIYSQPAIAAAEGSTGPGTHDWELILHQIADVNTAIDQLSALLVEVKGKLLPKNPPVGWQNWAADKSYDLELAVTARTKHSEHSAALIEAYKILRGESNSGGVNALMEAAESQDES